MNSPFSKCHDKTAFKSVKINAITVISKFGLIKQCDILTKFKIVHIHLVSPEYLQETMVIICVVIDCTDR